MRRSALTAFAVTAVLAVAACAPDSAERGPLVPTEPSLATSPQCAGGLASDIAKQQKALFTGDALTALQNQMAVIKSLCPNAVPQLMTYLQTVVTYGAPTTDTSKAQNLVNHWSTLVLYVKNETKTWPFAVLMGNGALGGVVDGGAKVLGANGSMTTFDGRAALQLPSTIPTGGPFLFTFEPVANSLCDNGTSLRVSGRCYDVSDYPDGGTYSTPAVISLCVHQPYENVVAAAGIGHAKHGFGTEVLPEVASSLSCAHDSETALNSWLGSAGPLGRAVAHAVDYLRPRALFADDAGESGSIGSFSLVGGILNEVFLDDFTDLASPPDIGDAWTINATSPGYIQLQNGAGDLSGSVVVLSQAQGNCSNCPVFSLLGTRVNAAETETVGSYEVTWQSVQTKPNVKEAPFVVLNDAGAEIARLSYVTESSVNKLLFTAGGVTTNVGTWVQNVHQDFKITVNLTTLNTATSQTVSISGTGVTSVTRSAPNATTLRQIGYVLTGIDAGIIGADNFRVIRLSDVP
jgi:hypothetical protein